jgi:pimeloyl-ACP methyl ester carboxylesterase
MAPLAEHFHVVAPSIPGYLFSDPPRRRGFSAVDAARLFHALMAALGYPAYFAHGGDWGSRISAYLGTLYPDAVRGVHITMAIAVPLAMGRRVISTPPYYILYVKTLIKYNKGRLNASTAHG